MATNFVSGISKGTNNHVIKVPLIGSNPIAPASKKHNSPIHSDPKSLRFSGR